MEFLSPSDISAALGERWRENRPEWMDAAATAALPETVLVDCAEMSLRVQEFTRAREVHHKDIIPDGFLVAAEGATVTNVLPMPQTRISPICLET